MGWRGRSKLRRHLMGSVSSKVIHRAPGLVTVVSENQDYS